MVAGLVDLDDEGRIKVDCANRTNVPGIFAAGDVTSGYAEQVLIAVGEGAKAALSAYEYLLPETVSFTGRRIKQRMTRTRRIMRCFIPFLGPHRRREAGGKRLALYIGKFLNNLAVLEPQDIRPADVTVAAALVLPGVDPALKGAARRPQRFLRNPGARRGALEELDPERAHRRLAGISLAVRRWIGVLEYAIHVH